jgi:hypothetical protein
VIFTIEGEPKKAELDMDEELKHKGLTWLYCLSMLLFLFRIMAKL